MKQFLLICLCVLVSVPGIVFGFPPPSDELPYGVCSNGQTIVYNTTTLRWDTCANNAAGGVGTDTIWVDSGDLVQGTGVGTAAKLTKGAEGTILRAGAASNAYSTATFADTYAKGTFLYNASANTVAGLAHPGAANYVLATNAADTAAWLLATNLSAINALTFADASIVQLTGEGTAAVLTSGGNNYILGSNSDNSALEFKTPANVLSQIGAQASDADLTAIAALACNENEIIKRNGAGAWVCAADATGGGTTMANDAVWAAKGDLAVASANDTGTVLTVGTAYQVLHVATDTPAWTSTLGATGTRLTKGWFADLEITNVPTVNGVAAQATNGLMLNLMTGAGDMLYGGASGVTTRLAAGTDGYILQAKGAAAPQWVNSLTGLSFDIGTIDSAAGQAVVMDADGVLSKVSTALLPDASGGATLGNATYPWGDTYLKDGVKIFVAAEDLILTATSTTLLTVSTDTGITDISWSALNMATTGTIQSGVKINTDSNGMTSGEMTTAGMYGAFYVAGGAGTWALPAAAAGMNFCIYSTTAAAVVVNPDDSDVITLNGTALSAGDSITSASGAGDFICLLAVSDSSWLTLGRSGTWTDTN